MSKRFLLDKCIVETANRYNVTVDNLDSSIQELLYCALYCDYVSKCKLIIVEDYKTVLTALGELARIYNIHGELAAWVLIDLWEILDEDKDLVECVTNGKYIGKVWTIVLIALGIVTAALIVMLGVMLVIEIIKSFID